MTDPIAPPIALDPIAPADASDARAPIALDPIAAAARLAGRPGRVLCHAAAATGPAGLVAAGRLSVLGADPIATLTVWPAHQCWRDAAGERTTHGDPIAAIDAFLAAHGCAIGAPAPRAGAPAGGASSRRAAAPAPRAGASAGGASSRRAVAPAPAAAPRVLGYLGYDLGRAIEQLGARPPGPAVPDAWLAAYAAVVIWPDAGPGTIVADDPAAAAALAAALAAGPTAPAPPPRLGPLAATHPAADHGAGVDAIRRYIEAGDVYQVNLARRLRAPLERDGDALALYAALHAVAPAAYGGLVEADGVRIVSGSPECFLHRTRDRIVTAPIKGTRRRGPDAASDRLVAADLAAHPKDAAEHLMIVDLERNDLGRVAEIGSVAVDHLGAVVALPGLYHMVSIVSARLRAGATWADVLRATFPGGSITGAPKIRAMQLIDELEPDARGPYCGALGWFGAGGTVDLAIAIRIATLTAGELAVHVGGGIVADSDRAAELAETEDKAAGWRAALAALAGS